MKRVLLVLMLACVLAPLGGCVVVPERTAGCAWVPGHYGPYGGWHRGHCA